jgi:hypothetical protein
MELSKAVAAPLCRGEFPQFARRQSAVATMLQDFTTNNRRVWLIAILIAVLHAAMAVTDVNTKSPTFDEPQHLTAGNSYWATNDFRLDPENGNLPSRWAAWQRKFKEFERLQFARLCAYLRHHSPVA